jgi:16S rRNA (guanine1516-N2)-methyltransferase
MVLLQGLLGKDQAADELFHLAITCARKRVVVKRPRLAAYISKQTPAFSYTGKSSRFDVYLT